MKRASCAKRACRRAIPLVGHESRPARDSGMRAMPCRSTRHDRGYDGSRSQRSLPRRRALARPGASWRDRLDARGAGARARDRAAARPARAAGARARRARRRADAVEAFLDPTIKRADARSACADRHGGGGGAPRRRGRCAARRSRSSATTMSTARPRRRCSRASCAHCGARSDHPHSRPHLRGLRPECRGDPRARRARREAAGHGRLRHDQPSSRWRKRRSSASTRS